MGLSSFVRSLVLVAFITAIFATHLGLVNSVLEVRKLRENSNRSPSPPSPIRNTAPRITEPLVGVLRIVDFDERPAMGYLYEEMHRAQEAIKTFLQYRPDTLSNLSEVMCGLLDMVEKLADNLAHVTTMTREIKVFRECEDNFGRQVAMNSCKSGLPDDDEEPPTLDTYEIEYILVEAAVPRIERQRCRRAREGGMDHEDVINETDETPVNLGIFDISSQRGQDDDEDGTQEPTQDDDDNPWLC
ncbi:hypothetical protein HHK36_006652 [Tetracentron sinense]|uniref:Uncharacterized protein n=1 Tax=Tetracentron sinense TaxID=13715 RepID=A0A835DL15_TETSI|nr:hypothetical protein HHK36_006652 [Tetracentron sinense]